MAEEAVSCLSHVSTFSEEYKIACYLTQLFPFWGMGDLAERLSLLLIGFVQLKSCASQAFSKERISLEVEIDLVKDSFDEI